MMKDMSTRMGLLALATVAAVGLSGCGDGTGPEGPGMMDVVMHDGSGTSSAAAQAAPGASSSTYSGTFEGDVTVQISADGQTWVDIASATDAMVELQSEDRTTVVSDVEVAADSYSHVRVTFRNATAQIDSGAEIDGTILGAVVNISIGSGSDIVVEKELFPFTIDGDTEMVLTVDLNSETWVDSQSVDSGTAASTQIQRATTVEARRK